MSTVNDILSTDENTFSDEELLSYLHHNLRPEEIKELDELMQHDSFINDAIEGLKQAGNEAQINQSVLDLNKHLQKNILARADKKRKRKLPSNQWTIIAISIVITLCLLGYFLIELMNKH
jgi:lipoate-protein ligase A